MRHPFTCVLLAAVALTFAGSALAADAVEGTAKPITFTIPEDGYVSLIIKDADGLVVRQLVNSEFKEKGEHTVTWDGLSTPYWKTPGTAAKPGEYTWSAIYHTGIGLRLRGWAYHGPSDPWDNGPTTYWGGDQALPISCAADDEKLYLGWAGAEAGKALIALDLDDNVLWAAGSHFNSATILATDGGIVYYVSGRVIKRVSDKNGKPVNWPGTRSGNLQIKGLWEDPTGMPSDLSWSEGGFEAANGKLYLSFSQWTWSKTDITDWQKFLTTVKKGGTVGKIIWEGLDDRCKKAVDSFLGGTPAAVAFKKPAYWVPDPRDVIVKIVRGLLSSKTLVEGADKLSGGTLAAANRRFLEKTFSDSTIKARSNFIAVVDIATAKLVKLFDMSAPTRIVDAGNGKLYVMSERRRIVEFDPNTGDTRDVITGLKDPTTLTVDKEGNIYVSVSGEDQQIHKYSPKGKLLLKIGKQGGRVSKGPWDPNGVSHVWGLAIDAKGKLWASEVALVPKRHSAWNPKTGEFIKEYLGPTHYGASGGAVNPVDPSILIGEGCEFRLDPITGRAKFTGIITQEIFHGLTRFCQGSNGRLYLAGSFKGRVWAPGEPHQIRIYERVGEGQYVYRAVIRKESKKTVFWADENGDEEEQPEEVTSLPISLGVGGYYLWSMNMNSDLTFYGTNREKNVQVKVKGFTRCGAPIYDLENAKDMPSQGSSVLSTPDNRLVLTCGESDDWFRCTDVATGKELWTYPNTFRGVHGSHRAPGPKVGMIRGSFGIIGNAQLPEPVGAVWAINTNVGEWHMLTEDGYYLSRLFQGNHRERKYPEKAVPGAVMDNCPPGLGGEDFGGSMIQGNDGKLYIEAGKVALWNVEVVGLDTVKTIKGGRMTLTPNEALRAELTRGQGLQAVAKPKTAMAKMMTPTFTGNPNRDFKGAKRLNFQKQRETAVSCYAAWDENNLYLAWNVKDESPWVNGADEALYMYSSGDTVDFQLATRADADSSRAKAAKGDLRLSIGNFNGKPTAVIYRRLHEGQGKDSATFSSGVIKEYVVESAKVITDAKIDVKTSKNAYIVEAAIPLKTLGLKISGGLKLRGDFGATHSDPNGQDTVLRTHWSNQATGIVSDEVFELKMEPRNWSELTFEE